MTVGTAKQLTAVLDSWVAQGIREDPLGSNRTPIGEEFGWNGVAWCAETMSVAQTRIGLHCFHEAAVVNAVAEAKRGANGLQWIPANGVIREGDMSCFQWGDGSHHISYVRDPGTQIKFQTDSGNEHDRMYQQWRDRKYVMGFIRLPYGAEPDHNDHPPATPAPLEEDDALKIWRPVGKQGVDPNVGGEFLQMGDKLISLDENMKQQLANGNTGGDQSKLPVADVEPHVWAQMTKPGACTVVE